MSCNEPLAKSVGANAVLLKDHLCQVADYARAVARAYRPHWERLLGKEWAERVEQALVLAALVHDLGKAAEGFQRSLHSRQYRWEFRHEVLSTALLLTAADSDDPIVRLTAAAVLTHHRHLDDDQLQRDSALPSLPEPDILQVVQQKFQEKSKRATCLLAVAAGFFCPAPRASEPSASKHTFRDPAARQIFWRGLSTKYNRSLL
jgi:CRISPR-associated endonuclease/helicase Cas3